MARIRSIHPDALGSDKLAGLDDAAERLWWRLQPECDDEGRTVDHPRLLAARCAPLIDGWDEQLVDGLLAQLHDAGLIVRYEVDGRRYLQVTAWARYQHPRRPRASAHPAPPGEPSTTTSPSTSSAGSPSTSGPELGEPEPSTTSRGFAARPQVVDKAVEQLPPPGRTSTAQSTHTARQRAAPVRVGEGEEWRGDGSGGGVLGGAQLPPSTPPSGRLRRWDGTAPGEQRPPAVIAALHRRTATATTTTTRRT